MRSEAVAVSQLREDPAEAGLGEGRRRGQNPATVTGNMLRYLDVGERKRGRREGKVFCLWLPQTPEEAAEGPLESALEPSRDSLPG